MEYALNANPAHFPKAEQLVVGSSGKVRFTRNLDATDIALEIEATADLATPFAPIATWTQLGGWTSIPSVAVTETGGAVEVVAPAGDSRFF